MAEDLMFEQGSDVDRLRLFDARLEKHNLLLAAGDVYDLMLLASFRRREEIRLPAEVLPTADELRAFVDGIIAERAPAFRRQLVEKAAAEARSVLAELEPPAQALPAMLSVLEATCAGCEQLIFKPRTDCGPAPVGEALPIAIGVGDLVYHARCLPAEHRGRLLFG